MSDGGVELSYYFQVSFFNHAVGSHSMYDKMTRFGSLGNGTSI